MARSRDTHFDSGKLVLQYGREVKAALCGSDAMFLTGVTAELDRVTCTKCAALLSQRYIEAYNAANPTKTLKLEKPTKGENEIGFYRNGYRVTMGGEHVGYIVMAGGWARTRWHIAVIAIKEADAVGPGHHLDKESMPMLNKRHFAYDRDGVPFVTKERALLFVPALVEAGTLRTKTKIKQDNAERDARGAIRRAKEAEQDAAEQAERNDALAGLIEIRDGYKLTNSQRVAIEYAIVQTAKKPNEL